jgi:RnfABCDGE-type electron transport complex G subunit
MSRLKHFVAQSWLLLASSFCFGLLIAVTNAALAGRIELNKIAKLNELTKALLPAADRFQPVQADIEVALPDGSKEKTVVLEALSRDQQCVGWSFNIHGMGFSGTIEMVIAVDRNFQKIMGLDVLSSSETPGFGDRIKSDWYRDQFAGAPADRLMLVKVADPAVKDAQIVALTGATVSSQAVVDTLNRFLTQIKDQMMKQKGLMDHVPQ